MNLTQIIEKAEGEFEKVWRANGLHLGYKNNKHEPVKSFLSEKIKEAYEAGEERGSRLATDEAFDLTT